MSRAIQEVRVQTQSPPARPVNPAEINRRIEDAVNQALSQIGDNQQDNARESIREAIEEIRDEIQDARAEGRSITIQPQFADAIPRGATEISIAFFVSMAFIIVGLPIARAWARRMDRRGEPASASRQATPRTAVGMMHCRGRHSISALRKQSGFSGRHSSCDPTPSTSACRFKTWAVAPLSTECEFAHRQ